MKKYISWRRVSTFKQNRSGLGLAAQKEIIRYFIEKDGGDWVADYEECYTGTELSGCVELKKAMAHAKQIGAVLIIAKTDRFRNTAEALKIYEEMGDGNIMFCDLPTSDKFSLTLFFALAEREALIVSIRTKQALAAKKSQGAKLGASSEVYKKNFEAKTKEQKKEESAKRGRARSEHHAASRDFQVFLKVLKNVFPNACADDNAANWDWACINTKGDAKTRMVAFIKDYKELDGDLFCKWAIDEWDATKIQVRLANEIKNVRNTVMACARYAA